MESRRGWRPIRSEEYQESDMFDLMQKREAISINDCIKPRESEQSSIGPFCRQLPSATMMIPRTKKNPRPEPKLVQQSAPVKIPDWSKIYGNSSRTCLFSTDQDCFDDCCGDDSDDFDGKRFPSYVGNNNDDGDGDDDEMEGRIPPHEWLAKKQRRKQISPFSVCEGAGRTLKGRDLRRVRHAVLTKTGFI